MKRLKILIPLTLFGVCVAGVATADSSTDAAIGGAIGGGLGSYLGNEVGGDTGAVLGGALGAATGAAIATDGDDRRPAYRPDYRYPAAPYFGYPTPYGYGRAYSHPGRFCPPGQAKKGRCW